MRSRRITLPELALIAGTRAALGAGAGMLVGERLDRRARRGAAWALVAFGVATTIPIAVKLLRRPRNLFQRLFA